MRALVWHGPEKLAVEEVAEPEAGPGEVLLAPEAVGVCGSEVEGYLGAQANRTPPLVMGHELAGRVVALGDGVEREWEGRRVAVNPLVAAPDAIAGIEQLAGDRQLIGVHRPGGFAERVAVPVHRLRSLPEGADARLGALAEPLANGVHAARIGRAGVEGGPVDRAVVIGAGTIGLVTLQAIEAGSIGVIEPHDGRRAMAVGLGAHEVAPDEGGFDLVFDAAGTPDTRRLALRLLRPGGCAVLIGLHADEHPIGFHDVIRRGLTIRGSYAYADADYDAALAMLMDGRAGLGELEAAQPLEAGPDAFAELAAGPSSRLKVFLAP